MRNKILVIDDEPDVLTLVASTLRAAGYSVLTAATGGDGLAAARQELPALIVLDLMLPGLSGLEVCKTLRSSTQTAAIFTIMLTARHEEYDRIVGFEMGADDYICKPFSPKELVLRVKSVLRRGEKLLNPVLQIGQLVIDRRRRELTVGSQPVALTSTEFDLLVSLALSSGRVLSRQNLLERLRGTEASGESRAVDVHVRHLREKLGPAAECIETVRGFGYRITDNGAEE